VESAEKKNALSEAATYFQENRKLGYKTVALCKINNEEVCVCLFWAGFFFGWSQYWKSGKTLQRTPLREDTGALNTDCVCLRSCFFPSSPCLTCPLKMITTGDRKSTKVIKAH